MIARFIAWLRRLDALAECAFGGHVPDRNGAVHGYSYSRWRCKRCGDHFHESRSPL